MDNINDLFIRHKGDHENARRLIAIGYPQNAPAVPHLMEWIQDMNWPVAKTVAPFLASIGEPILAEVRKVFDTEDFIWKYWCINDIIGRLPTSVANQFRPELERLAFHPTCREQHEELDDVARDVLHRLDQAAKINA